MERKIGEIFEEHGEWYQCVVATQGCRECSFRTHDYCIHHLECLSDTRSDKTSVIFKKLEKVGEPYIEHDHSMNKDVVVQDYKLYNQHACYNGHEEMLSFGLSGRVGMVTIKSKEPIKSLNCENSVEIEIKQNKEDMEENKLNLKPFDIQKAREGKPVCTRDGRKARIICFDGKGDKPIIALVEAKGNKDALIENVERYFINGHSVFEISETNNDLMMLPEKKEGWVNVYKDSVYDTKDEALIGRYESRGYIDTIKVSWEE